ncbi:hypothetical protein CBS101457_005377 [Exobasidium rhododendri]|nr:hypothetical protein CBS101457_005377 [Exobasidium rhododendri]
MLHGGEWLVKKYASLAQPRGNQTLDTTLITLASRLQNVTSGPEDGRPTPPLPSLQDRKAAVLGLKGLARDHPVEVGDKAFGALLESLCRDAREDDEIARAIVEACLTLCETAPSGPSNGAGSSNYSGTLTKDPSGKMFLDTPNPLHALLPLLSPTRSFYTRFSSLQLLTILLRVRVERVQEHVLTSPGGCGAVLECLSEGSGSSAEIVRNEALLLLPLLVSNNADIQKLVAFEGAFEKLIDVVAVEGRIEGGVVVQDALEALVALLRYNVSNQNYFRETLSVPLLAPLLFYPPPPPAHPQAQQEYAHQIEAFAFQQWYTPIQNEMQEGQETPRGPIELDEQKVINATLVLKVAALLIEGQGDGKRLNQNALFACGFTKCLFELALASTAPLSLKSQALNVLSGLLRSNVSNQDLLTKLLISPLLTINTAEMNADDRVEPSYTRLPARPAIVELISLAVNGPSQGTTSKASLAVRASALNCFDSFVNDNLDARLGIINTMVPSPSENGQEDDDIGVSVGAGKLLLEGVSQFPTLTPQGQRGGKFDPYKYLISSFLFSHLIRGSETAKDLARGLLFGADGNVIGQVDARKKKSSNDVDDDDDEQSSLIQVLVGNFTMALREHGEATRRERGAGSASKSSIHGNQGSPADWTRVQIGYLIILSTWFWDSKSSVEEFVKESSNLQVLIQPVSQGGNLIDPIVSGLCAVVLGIVYEFGPIGEKGSEDEGIVTRAAMHPILHSRIGPDQFAARLNRLRDDARFKNTEPDVLENVGESNTTMSSSPSRSRDLSVAPTAASSEIATTDENGGVWFDWNFVDFIKSNHVLIQKSILVDPQTSSTTQANQSTELLDARRQFDQMKENHSKVHREYDILSKKMKEMEEAAREEKQSILEQLDNSLSEIQALKEEIQRLNDSSASKDRETGNGLKESQGQVEALEGRLRAAQEAHEAKDGQLSEAQSSRSAAREENEALKRQLKEAQEAHTRQLEEAQEAQKKAVAEAEAAQRKTAEQVRDSQERAAKELQEAHDKFAAASTLNGAPKTTASEEDGDEKSKEDLEKELEDLLILLDELSTKRKADKKKMREKGMQVSEDEGDEEDDDEDGDDVD